MLLTIRQAKAKLKAKINDDALKEAARDHGHLVTIGARSFIPESELMELIDKCRHPRKAPDSSYGKGKAGNLSTSSKTLASESVAQAQVTSSLLKKRSMRTGSKRSDGQRSQRQRK